MKSKRLHKLILPAFRIILGVVVLACAILLLGFLGSLLVKVAPRFSLFLLGCVICGLGVHSILVCLRYGWAGGGKVTAYTRYGSPFHFWCNVLFRYFIALAGLALCLAAFFIPK